MLGCFPCSYRELSFETNLIGCKLTLDLGKLCLQSLIDQMLIIEIMSTHSLICPPPTCTKQHRHYSSQLVALSEGVGVGWGVGRETPGWIHSSDIATICIRLSISVGILIKHQCMANSVNKRMPCTSTPGLWDTTI